jgi:Protein of unknown function (DUF2849)
MTSPLQQKLKVTGPVVVTANRLGDGAVVYRTAQGSWTGDLAGAAVVTTAPAATELLAAALADKLRAVDAYVAPVKLTAEQSVVPGNLRERIRLNGPTIPLPGES